MSKLRFAHVRFRGRIARLDGLLGENGRGRKMVKRSLMTQVVIGKDEAAVRAKLIMQL